MKNIEIEAKMRLADREAMVELLGSCGATPKARIHEINTFFDTPDNGLKRTDQGLRVRVETEDTGERKVIITHKGPRAHGDLKSRAETELEVGDPNRAAALLDALGYRRVLSFEKHRERWLLDGCTIELDSVPYLGEFIEIEGSSEESVLAVRKTLGLEGASMIKSSYIAMLGSYLRERGMTMTHVCFEDVVAKA